MGAYNVQTGYFRIVWDGYFNGKRQQGNGKQNGKNCRYYRGGIQV